MTPELSVVPGALALAAVVAFVLGTALVVVRCLVFRRWTAPKTEAPTRTVVVLGSGGHTAEMLKLLTAFSAERYSPRVYVAADTDTSSEKRAKARKELPEDAVVHRIARSREVGQSYLSALLPTAGAFLQSCLLLHELQPGLLLCNGPGTCLPVCIAAGVLNFLGLLDCRVVFVESVCRVQSLSMTGKILYWTRLADQIQVQWKELSERYPRCKYVGLLL